MQRYVYVRIRITNAYMRICALTREIISTHRESSLNYIKLFIFYVILCDRNYIAIVF